MHYDGIVLQVQFNELESFSRRREPFPQPPSRAQSTLRDEVMRKHRPAFHWEVDFAVGIWPMPARLCFHLEGSQMH